MKFKVVGAHRETGDDVRMVIEAIDKTAAEQWATDNNIMWTEIVPQGSPSHLANATQPVAPRAAVRRVESGPPSAFAANTTVHVPLGSQATILAQTFVPPARGVSGFGIASLIMGVLACLFCWIPLCGMATIPVAAIGILLALVGFLISLIGRKSGVGMPVAGGFVCALAIVLAVGVTLMAVDGAAAAQAARERTNQQAIPRVQNNPGSQNNPANAGGAARPEPVPRANNDEWALADVPVRQGDIELKVLKLTIGKVPLMRIFGGDTATSEDDLLSVHLEIKNMSESRKVDYRSWSGGDFSLSRDYATLQDNFDNVYKRTGFGATTEVVGATKSESVYPGKSIQDILVFEPPIDKAEFLKLELPASNFGGSGMLRVKIPRSMIGK